MADYENKSVEWLYQRLGQADKRWEEAMLHPKYLDEPKDDKSFTPAEALRYWWADTWRNLFHEYENALYARREVRHGLIEGVTEREPPTIYEDD